MAQTIKVSLQQFIFNNLQSEATGLAGQPEPELPSHHTTWGTGFTAAAPWEQSPVPPVFGWPLSYVTEQLWNSRHNCVLVIVGRKEGKMSNSDHGVCVCVLDYFGILGCVDESDKCTNGREEWKKKWTVMLERPLVPDSFMDGYVIGMAAHSSPIEGQHLNKQNILLC